MDVIWLEEAHQNFQFPEEVFKDDISIGSYVQVTLSDGSFVIGRSFLASPKNVQFLKLTRFCSKCCSLQNDAKFEKVEKIEVSKEPIEVDISIVCRDVETTLNYQHEFLIQRLKNVVFTSGSVIDLQDDELFSDDLVQVQIEVVGTENAFFKLDRDTKVRNIKKKTFARTLKNSEEIRLGGLQKQERILRNLLTLKHRHNLNSFLISGPPGSGKTSLVKQVFDQDFLQLRVQCSSLMRPHPGETEKLLRDLFRKASLHAQEGPTLLLFEDVDLIGNAKNGEDSRSSHNLRAISQLRSLLDEFQGTKSLIFGATTSLPTNVHESLRRPGRFTNEIFIQVPSLQERQEIIEALDQNELTSEECLEIAQVTQGYVGADLAAFLSLKTKEKPFKEFIKDALKLTSPSGFKSGIGSVQLNPLSWNQIGGLQEVKQKLQSAIMWPLLYPEWYKKLDVKRTKGVLIYGPPGCGKTTLVRAMASMAGATFLSISAATIFSPYVGDSEKALNQVFHKARLGAPSVLFIDEIDGMVTNREASEASSGVQERVLSVLLNEMDGIGSTVQGVREEESLDNDVIVVGATNRPELLDAALIRPGRFDKIIYVPPPDEPSRLDILKVATSRTPLSESVNLEQLSQRTQGFSGADLDNLCKEAALRAMTVHGLDGVERVDQEDFEDILKGFESSLDQSLLDHYQSLHF